MTRNPSLFAALAALPVAACVVGPDYHAPVTPKVEGYQSAPLAPATAAADTEGGAAIRLTQGADPEARWWTVYGSADIDALVDQALKANPDLKSAQAALKAAEEAYFAQRAAIWPTVSAGYNLQRQKTAAVEASPLASNAETFTLHTTQLSIAYAPDVFGGLKRQAESAEAQAEAARFQARAAYVTLTANVVQAAVQEAALKDQLEATRALIADGRTQLDLMRRQKELGEISGADVAAQETAIAQLEQNLPPLERQIGQQQDLLAVLTGRYPSQVPDSPLTLSKLSLPAELPVSLPSAVVAHRPDIQAAAANLHVASANVGVAVAARLPSFTLSAAAGGAGTDLSNLFTHGDEFWSLGLDAAQTVFDGGALKHKQKAAEALLDQAEAQYRSTVLSAFQNVADCLAALQADSRTLAAAASAERSARTSLGLAQKQQEAGQTSSLVVLAARQAWRQARLVRLQAEAARYADTVALYQAMGGDGWRQAAWKAEQ